MYNVINNSDYIQEKLSKEERFIKKFGHWWYLRDLDFLPEPCENYTSAFKMNGKWMEFFNEGTWMVFNDLEKARNACNAIRKTLGMQEYKFNLGSEEYKFN